jgi:large subunit ribosomal protein L10
MKKAEKGFFVDNLSEELKNATSIVLVDYTGLSVKKQQEMKKLLKEIGAKMFVTKNTLFKIAGKNAKIPEETISDTVLSGPTAFIMSEGDPIAPIQVLAKFSQINEIPQFKVAVINGIFQDKETLLKLSKLPSLDILHSQVVGSIASPIYGLLGTLQGNLQKLVYLLSVKAQNSNNQNPTQI